MIARPDVLLDDAAARGVEDGLTRENVVQAPADVPLAHVAPRGPPREQLIVLGIERAAGVDQAVADDPFEEGALLGKLADDTGLPFLRMHVYVGPGDVQVTADDHRCRR